MTLSESRKSQSWKGAVEIGPGLVRLAEELPASEEMGLSLQLRQLMVEIPAAVAADLMDGTTTRRQLALRLLVALELIDRVYPALDTADTRKAAEQLAENLMNSADFEASGGHATASQEEAPRERASVPVAVTADDNSTPEDTAPAAEPTHVTVQAVTTAEENPQSDVHSNNVE